MIFATTTDQVTEEGEVVVIAKLKRAKLLTSPRRNHDHSIYLCVVFFKNNEIMNYFYVIR